MKRLSVIIVTYHSENDIYDCLQSFWQHADVAREELEVIVVDNSPESDTMFDRLRQLYGPDIVLVHNTHNGGYGQGNNVGIKRATAPVVMIMNPDVRLCEPVLQSALKAFDSDPRLSLYGMKQMCNEQEPSPYSVVCTYMMNGYLFTLLTSLANRLDFFWPKYMYLSGSCFFARKAMVEAVGMYDETNFMYGEEDDLRHRLICQYGASMKYNSKLHYIHPMHTRQPDIEYEKKLIDAAIKMNEKNGYPRRLTVRNRLRNLRLLIWREELKQMLHRGEQKKLEVMKQKREYLIQILRES